MKVEAHDMAQHTELDAHHRSTVEKIFNHPVSHNIQWHDVLSLLQSVATVSKEADGRYTVTLGSETETFDSPRHHDVDEQQVVDLRRMLRGAGIIPGSPAGPDTEDSPSC
jgi:thiamine biosynthesis lipoprotein ApbE